MPIFAYIAKNAGGEEVSGSMQAENETAVARALDERKLFPVQVKEQALRMRRLGRGKINQADVGVMYGQLADLLRSGVPMLRSMDTLSRAITNRRLSAMVVSLREDIAAGKTLADAMGGHSDAFPPLHCAMVHAGERAGFLEDVLTNLAEFLERQDELRGKIRGAMIYPIVLAGIGSILMLGILVFLVPQFRGFFQKIELPLPTQILFSLSALIVDYKLFLIAAVVVLVLAVRSTIRSAAGRLVWDRWKLKIPLLGRVLRMLSITRFCRILGTMLANGVPILQSLAISKDATGSLAMSELIEKAGENVRAGEGLAEPLRAGGLFPPEVLEMIAVAEESNQLEKVLVHIADTVERRTNRQVDQAVRLIEPLILVFMAAMIGFVAVGLLYPIFTMSQTLK